MTEKSSPISAREVAERLGVNERTVRRWVSSGDLAATKARGQFWISLPDAEAVFAVSRAAKSSEQAEWRGRYLEVSERLERAEAELARERERRIRAELVLWPHDLEVVAQ